jgi:hypothetical protein
MERAKNHRDHLSVSSVRESPLQALRPHPQFQIAQRKIIIAVHLSESGGAPSHNFTLANQLSVELGSVER